MEILEKLGLEVSLVGGGQEAADAVAADQYSLVLMDCQMPGVDGYMATRLIREREANGRRLPIVACTAHALEDERKKVEAAGMDGYLSKPIEFEALTAVLSRWLDSASVESSPIEPGANDLPSESDRDTSKILSAQPDERIATSNGLLPVLDPERAPSARVAAIFMKNVPNELTRLRNSAASNDREVVKAVAHKLKGSAGSIGATLLSAECDRLQIDAETMSNAEMNATVTAVERFYEQVRSELVARTPGELH